MPPRSSPWPYLAHLPFVAWTFAGPLFYGLVPYFRDIFCYYAPTFTFLERSLAQGVWPLWNPTADAGAPFLATNPITLLLVRMAGALGALRFGPPLVLLLAMSGATWLATELGLGAAGAWLAGLAYGLSGYFLSTVNLVELNHSAAWAPWVIAASLRLWAAPSARRVALAALVAALMVSTLSAETVMQTALATLVLLSARPNRRRLAAAAAASVLALLLSMPSVLGALSLVGGTQRSAGFSPATGFAYSAHPALLLDLLVPRAFGDVHTFSEQGYWGQPFFTEGFPYLLSLYVGPALLWLALRARRSSLAWRLLGLGALGALLALGDRGPLGFLLAPLLRHFRTPVKFVFLTHLALSLLAPLGLERARREALRPAWLGLGSGVALVALALLTRSWPGLPARLLGGLVPEMRGPRALAVVASGWPGSLTAAGAFLIGTALAAHSRRLLPLAALLVGLDLGMANGALNLATDPSFYALRPQVSQLLRDVRAHPEARLFAYGAAAIHDLRWNPELASRNRDVALYAADRQSLLPRCNVLDGLDGALDEDRTGFAPAGATLDPRERVPSLFAQYHGRLRLAAVRYVLSFRPLPQALVRERGEAVVQEVLEPLRLYELLDPLPRAFTVRRYEVLSDPQRLAALVESPGQDPREVVLLSQAPPAPLPPLEPAATPAAGGVSLERPSAHELRLKVEGAAGLLVVSEGYDHGWHAYAAEGERPLLRANGRYWAIPIRGGGETITARFEPAWRFPALAALGLGAACVLALALWPRSSSP